MPETPFDPAPMPVAGAFSEPAAIKAHAEMVNQINVLRSDRDTWRRLCREAQAEVSRLEGLLLSVARVIRGRDGLPCWCDDYDARPDHTHSAKCIEARRIRAQREEG